MHYEGDELEGRFKKVVQSRPPLRWFANIAGSLSSYHITKAFKAQHMKKDRLSNFHAMLAHNLLKPYTRWGTMYQYKPEVQD